MLVHGRDIYYGINVVRALEPWNILRDYHLGINFGRLMGLQSTLYLHIIPNPSFHVPLQHIFLSLN